MNAQELSELARSITPEKVRQAAITIYKKSRHKELRAVALYRVVRELVTGVSSPELPSYWRAWAGVREAVLAAVRQADDMTYVEAT